MTTPITGSISHGTLRTVDLIDRFTSTLDILDTNNQYFDLRAFALSAFNVLSGYEERREYPSHAAHEVCNDIMEELFTALESFAPSGFYFGAHPGDGSDFGFWPCCDDYEQSDTDADDE